MSCCGLFRAKPRAKLGRQNSGVATIETERSLLVRNLNARKTMPEKVLNPEAIPRQRKLTVREKGKSGDAGEEPQDRPANPAYCLNVPWKQANVDPTRATPFHIYSPGEKKRF